MCVRPGDISLDNLFTCVSGKAKPRTPRCRSSSPTPSIWFVTAAVLEHRKLRVHRRSFPPQVRVRGVNADGCIGPPSEPCMFVTPQLQTHEWLAPSNAHSTFTVVTSGDLTLADTILWTEEVFVDRCVVWGRACAIVIVLQCLAASVRGVASVCPP